MSEITPEDRFMVAAKLIGADEMFRRGAIISTMNQSWHDPNLPHIIRYVFADIRQGIPLDKLSQTAEMVAAVCIEEPDHFSFIEPAFREVVRRNPDLTEFYKVAAHAAGL